jgi:hypothetical protein
MNDESNSNLQNKVVSKESKEVSVDIVRQAILDCLGEFIDTLTCSEDKFLSSLQVKVYFSSLSGESESFIEKVAELISNLQIKGFSSVNISTFHNGKKTPDCVKTFTVDNGKLREQNILDYAIALFLLLVVIGIIWASFTGISYMFKMITTAFTVNSSTQVNSQSKPSSLPERSESSVQTQSSKCTKASGYIWTDVRLYQDSRCTQPFATVYAGGQLQDGRKGVLLKFDNGVTEWKAREAVTSQSYVKTDDPAIEAKLFREINQ